jgi:superfamily II DNA or RNA helicase
MSYRFHKVEPGRAYISNNLVLPKDGVHLAPIKAALTFQYGEIEVFDEDGMPLGTRSDELKLWDENSHHIIVPRDFIDSKHYHEFGFDFVDHRPRSYPDADIQDNIYLRDEEQLAAYNALCTNDGGTMNLACGKGKTILALKLAAKFRVPTIIVVNTTALLEQWKQEVGKFLDVRSIGIVQGDQFDWEHPIVISMVQTLSCYREQWPMRFRRHFGLVFYDEGHHMSAPVFVKSADLFFGKRYCLTATATRTDGLQAIYQHHLGRVIHKNLSQELIPKTFFYRLKWEFDERYKPRVIDSNNQISIPRVRTYLGELDWRNNLIYRHALDDIRKGRSLLILSHSVKHVERLVAKIAQCSDALPGIITGDTPQEERMHILHHRNPVVGTFQLAREGLNKPTLDTLYVTTPFSNPNDLQQSWGRIQRKDPNKKEPVVRVYEDLAFSCMERACRTLRGHLKSIGYPIQMKRINVED